jgi:glycosyltransferase involved in cell wall biosynthesis
MVSTYNAAVDKVGFLFLMGHGHATQFANFQECIPEAFQDRAVWIALHGKDSSDFLANTPWLPHNIRYGRHTLWHAKEGLSRQPQWQALFVAAEQLNFLSLAQRHRCYFYLDFSPSLKKELAPWYNHQLKNPVFTALQTTLKSRLYRSGQGVFAMSEWAARGLRKDYGLKPERVHVTLPGANLKRWHFVDRQQRSPRKPVRILMVGGEFQRKGGQMLLEWAERTCLKNWELDMVTWPGELPDWVKVRLDNPGGDTKACASLAPRLPNVRIHCGLGGNSPVLMELFERADIFCLPTQADGSSIASLEAMASGLPVIAGAVGGIPELIEDGVTGMLAKQGDGADMQARLECLIEDSSLRAHLGLAARAACERYYNVERQMQEIFTVIDQECRKP